MSRPPRSSRVSPAPVPLLQPGFGWRLGGAFCVALLLAYGLLALTAVARAGGPEQYTRKADFLIVLTGAAILAGGHPAQLYDEAAQTAAQAALLREAGYTPVLLLPYNHPPFEALLVAGWRAVGLSAAASLAVWTALSLVAVAATLAALRWGWPVPGRPGVLATGLALTFFPLTAGLLLGQSTALVLLGWAAGSAALRRGADGWAGLAFVLATLKPQAIPVVLLALLLMRRWRALAAWAAGGAVAVAVTLPVLGLDWPLRYLAFVLRVAAWPPSPALDPAQMQSWRGLFARLLGDGALATGFTVGATLLSLAVVVALWWRTDLRPGRPGRLDWDGRWAVTLLLALLVDPHLLPHDLALALVPGWILAAAALRGPAPRPLTAWLGLGWALGLLTLYHDLPVPIMVFWLAITAGYCLLAPPSQAMLAAPLRR